jgi:prepilin-type N-terminal cleavage/methylation domain-containing protein
MLTHSQINKRKNQRGFTLAEVALSLIVFAMMSLVFSAVFPIAIKSAHYSNYYSQAALIAQHKIDQMRSAGFGKLDCTDLVSLGIVDNVTNECGPSYSFAQADNLSGSNGQAGFFPAGTTGTISIVDYSTLPNVSNPPPAGNVYIVTVNVTWPGSSTMQGSYSTSAMIIEMTHE